MARAQSRRCGGPKGAAAARPSHSRRPDRLASSFDRFALALSAAAMAEQARVQSPRPGRYGLSAVGQLFSKDTQAIFFNWQAAGARGREC